MLKAYKYKLKLNQQQRFSSTNHLDAQDLLSIKNMLQNRSLSKSISSVAWSKLISMLKYKAEWYGVSIYQINKWTPTSKVCSCCGHKNKLMPLNIRSWICPSCNIKHDRDINAAINIHSAGMKQYFKTNTPSARGEELMEISGYRINEVRI